MYSAAAAYRWKSKMFLRILSSTVNPLCQPRKECTRSVTYVVFLHLIIPDLEGAHLFLDHHQRSNIFPALYLTAAASRTRLHFNLSPLQGSPETVSPVRFLQAGTFNQIRSVSLRPVVPSLCWPAFLDPFRSESADDAFDDSFRFPSL